MDGPVLIAYDGSPAAEQAIRKAAKLLASSTATVLTVWDRPLPMPTGMVGDPTFPVSIDPTAAPEIEAAFSAQSAAIADRGAAIASEAGFGHVTARAEQVDGREWRTILAVADDVDASVIVMGTRGLSGIKSAVMGSVSQAVSHHTRLPVLLVSHD